MRRSTVRISLAGLDGTAAGFQRDTLSGAESDGRRRRRLQNREAVVDALLDLYREGNLRPSTDEIAERARLSPRSLFRYFDDVDDLAGAAVVRAQARAIPLLPLSVGADAPLPQRIKALVDQRLRLFQEVGHAAAVVRLRAPFQPVLASQLAQNRAFLREQVREVFAAELAGLSRSRSRDVLAVLDVLGSFESFDLLQSDQGLGPSQTKAALASAMGALLASVGAGDGTSDGVSSPR